MSASKDLCVALNDIIGKSIDEVYGETSPSTDTWISIFISRLMYPDAVSVRQMYDNVYIFGKIYDIANNNTFMVLRLSEYTSTDHFTDESIIQINVGKNDAMNYSSSIDVVDWFVIGGTHE